MLPLVLVAFRAAARIVVVLHAFLLGLFFGVECIVYGLLVAGERGLPGSDVAVPLSAFWIAMAADHPRP